MSTRHDFASFTAYTPPPDAPAEAGTSKSKRPWFPAHQSSNFVQNVPGPSTGSYQAGGVPTFGTSMGGGAGHVEDQMGINEWETRFGWRVDVEAAVAYIGGPVTALLLLIVETSNDFVRFHAYQSALLITPLLLLRGFTGLIFPSWLQFISTMSIVVAGLYMAFRAFKDANGAGLVRYQLPYIGILAERWLGEE
ncbi:hypothetical protein RSOLAG1IB_09511 [Rhizoctonia solani AG-1 IB]|uniref:Uncharacterized protein n=2 Tax=Rhizoctonia solani TaxID=456999 RepID=M5C4W7_THACB|nr:unnamed protein product [Rhizoctonia solani]CCO34080.1 hypothetical protein BN14_08172 [Rhizoctonia solani AG-1 IB]CEL60287.1 hypothetical protein RSOLAG1IB_09511 [Rhizoctonia solani AG-1 IB]